MHCVKSVQIRSLFWSVFSRIRTEYGNVPLCFFFWNICKQWILVIITKSLRKMIGKTLCEWWKCMCKLFEINGQKDFQKSVVFSKSSVASWRCGCHYCTSSFIKAWTQVLCMFKSCLRRIGDSQWWGSLTMSPPGNKAKRLSSFNHTAKAIHHYHHHHHHYHHHHHHHHQNLHWEIHIGSVWFHFLNQEFSTFFSLSYNGNISSVKLSKSLY